MDNDCTQVPDMQAMKRPYDFSDALKALKQGYKIQRDGWNGKGIWVELQKPDENSKMTLPYIFIEYPSVGLEAGGIKIGNSIYPNGCRVPWLASQTDLLAEDWHII